MPVEGGPSSSERSTEERRIRLLESAFLQTSEGILIARVSRIDGIRLEALLINESFEKITGFQFEDLRQGALAALCKPLLEAASGDLQTQCLAEMERELRRKDGSEFWAECTFKPLEDESGEYAYCVWTIRDITERKRAEEMSRLFSSLVENSDDAILTENLSGVVVTWNKSAERIYGYTQEEIVGQPVTMLYPPHRALELRELLDSLRRGARIEHFETERVHKNGNRIYVSLTMSPIQNSRGYIVGASVISRDIGERKLAEERVQALNRDLERRVAERTQELEAANRELEAFAYSVSHDLRAPLRAIDGFSRILLEEYASELPAEAQRYLNLARKNALQMGTLIDSLLAFSRLSRQPVAKRRIAPDALARQVIDDLRPEREGRRVDIFIGQMPACQGDPQLLRQVFTNLLSNSLKYTRERDIARIEVGASEPDPNGDSVFYVRDNGVGFDMRYADKLFGVFQRLHRDDEYPGTGVGLAIVQRIIQRHGGRVWAHAAVNEGATFYFVLSGLQPGKDKHDLCQTHP